MHVHCEGGMIELDYQNGDVALWVIPPAEMTLDSGHRTRMITIEWAVVAMKAATWEISI